MLSASVLWSPALLFFFCFVFCAILFVILVTSGRLAGLGNPISKLATLSVRDYPPLFDLLNKPTDLFEAQCVYTRGTVLMSGAKRRGNGLCLWQPIIFRLFHMKVENAFVALVINY